MDIKTAHRVSVSGGPAHAEQVAALTLASAGEPKEENSRTRRRESQRPGPKIVKLRVRRARPILQNQNVFRSGTRQND